MTWLSDRLQEPTTRAALAFWAAHTATLLSIPGALDWHQFAVVALMALVVALTPEGQAADVPTAEPKAATPLPEAQPRETP